MAALWYDLTPAEYARTLRFNAERARRMAPKQRAEGFPYMATVTERGARRCGAMACLCDLSTAARAGDVDFQGLDRPETPDDVEDATIARILEA